MTQMRRVAGWAAVVALSAYVGLKVLWILGVDIGVENLGTVSREDWIVENAVTLAIGLIGVLVALATVRPWGMRVPLWLVAVPTWVGAGLLAPAVILLPAAALLHALGWWAPPAQSADGSGLELSTWVFLLVYGSFVIGGIALAVALALYARRRLGGLLSATVASGRRDVTHVAQVPLAWLAAVLAIGLAGLRLLWAAGIGPGLVAHRDAWLRLGDVVTAAQVLAAAGGLLVLVNRWGGDRPFAVPLVATWLGAGGMVGTSYLDLPAILSGEQSAPVGQSFAIHASSTFITCVAGSLITVVTLFLLVEREARLREQPHAGRAGESSRA